MYINQYLAHLKKDKKMTKNTIEAYKRDMLHFAEFLNSRGIDSVKGIGNTEIVGYIIELKDKDRSVSTVNRKLASLRSYFRYNLSEGNISSDPTDGIKTPKMQKKEITYLTIEEMDKVLSTPDVTIKGKRDRAILELMYATGIRVSELIDIKVQDINLRIGFLSCYSPGSKPRIIPLGRPARAVIEEYIYDARAEFKKNNDTEILFLNYKGNKFTRQGLWKLIKQYAKLAGIETEITPQIFRNSFAVHMIQNGADLKSLQELLGHEDIAATQIYLSVTKNKIKEVYDNAHPRA